VLAPYRFRGVTPYLIGLVGVVVATLLRFPVHSAIGEHLSYGFDFLAVFIAAWTGGLWPAVATAVLSSFAGDFFFSSPRYSFKIDSLEELLEMIVFVAVSVIIGVLTEISHKALVRAKEAERDKDNFMAAVAHEMRSPLSVIGYANSLNRLAGIERSKDQLDVIDRQVHHLNRMIEDLLEVSRVARGKVKLERRDVDLASVIAGAVERVKPLIDSRRHTLAVQTPPRPVIVNVDSLRMIQVLGNLLTNAAKYTPDGGQIFVRVEPAGKEAVIRVRDNGIGIAAEELPRVFDLFAQSEASRDRAAGGLGIGLALARKIVEVHGGTIVAKSGGRDCGSEFTVSLPMSDATAATPAKPAVSLAPAHA
jgi:signal transduction histidine kinase